MTENVLKKFESIREKVLSRQRLSFEDGLVLYDPAVPLQEVGELANLVRERMHGNVAYYNINTHLNRPTFVSIDVDSVHFEATYATPKGIR